VNRSINQTISRTLLTSVTTLLAVVIMYAEGGSGIRPFTFCLLVGLLVGTYSSVAVAAPLVLRGGGSTTPAPAPASGEPATT
jgi:SecD/SecF fusion protein